jgi:hypothetical protein
MADRLAVVSDPFSIVGRLRLYDFSPFSRFRNPLSRSSVKKRAS